jgi:hypothetical protein
MAEVAVFAPAAVGVYLVLTVEFTTAVLSPQAANTQPANSTPIRPSASDFRNILIFCPPSSG